MTINGNDPRIRKASIGDAMTTITGFVTVACVIGGITAWWLVLPVIGMMYLLGLLR